MSNKKAEKYREIIGCTEDIQNMEAKIEKINLEIEELKNNSGNNYRDIWDKKLEICELENEIKELESIVNRNSSSIIANDTISKKDENQYAENKYMYECYLAKNELDRNYILEEKINLKLKILNDDRTKNKITQEEFKKEIEILKQEQEKINVIISSNEKKFEKLSKQYEVMGGKEGNNIDFDIPYSQRLFYYDGTGQCRYNSDILEFEGILYNKIEQENVDKKEYFENNIKNKVSETFTNSLTGNEKELGEIYSEIFSNHLKRKTVSQADSYIYEIDDILKLNEFNNINYTNISMIIKNNLGDILIYEEDGKEIGIPLNRNKDTGELEIVSQGVNFLSNDEIKKIKENNSYDSSITYEQLESQIIKHNIEQSMGGQVNEIIELNDEQAIKYLTEENNLTDFTDTQPRIYVVSKIDENGNNYYEFVSRYSNNSYMKLSGMENVVDKQENIIIENDDNVSDGLNPMPKVDCQFLDKNGNNYYIYHSFERLPMEVACRTNQEKEIGKVSTKDSGINGLWHNNRVKELLKAGYNAFGIGYNELKQVYSKFRDTFTKDENKDVR